MCKRFISLLLAVCLVFGLLPPGVLAVESANAQTSTLDDPSYTRDIRVWWGEDGEYEWHSFYLPEVQERFTESTDDLPLPDGVSFDGDTLTLSGAALFAIRVDNWGDAPFRLKIRGENTIHSTDESRFALNLYGCHDLLIDGGGTLNLSGNQSPLYNHDAYIENNRNYPDGLLTIRDVTLNVECVYDDADFPTDNAWIFNAAALTGNTVLDGVTLYIRGHNGLEVSGDLTITGGSVIDADGLYLCSRPMDDRLGHEGGYYPSTGLIEDATLYITPHRNKGEDDFFIFDIGPGTEMTIADGADITVDASHSRENWNCFIVHDDYTQHAVPGVLHLQGGRIEVFGPANQDCTAVNVATGSTWNQSGGDVIVHINALNAGGFSLWQDCAVDFSGGSITVHDAAVTMNTNTHWNQSGGSLRVIGGAQYGEAFACWERGTVTLTGGTMELEGTLITGRDSAFRLHDGAVELRLSRTEFAGLELERDSSFTQTGGSFAITNDAPTAPEFLAACYLNPDAELLRSSGSFTVGGDFTHGIWSSGDLTVTGGQTHIQTNRFEAVHLLDGGTMTMAGGQVDLQAPNEGGIVVDQGSGLSVLGGTLRINSPDSGIILGSGHARFLGGETVIDREHTAGMDALVDRSGRDVHSFTFGEGINTLDADGKALEFRYDGSVRAHTDRLPVTIRRQGAAADTAAILMNMTRNGTITVGAPTGVRMIPLLTQPRGTVTVTLPAAATLVADSVYAGAAPIAYTMTGEGFTVEADSGSVITFTIIPQAAGENLLTAACDGCTETLAFSCDAYRLSLPAQVNVPEIRTHGTAMAGGSLVFYLDSEELLTVPVSSLGTWSAVLPLPDEAGYYNISALVRDAQGNNITVSQFHQVLYSPDAPVVETLTVSNWIHGNSMVDPHKQTKVVINYLTGQTDPGYYIYWPDLPEFTLEAAFAGSTGTPEQVSDVCVIATDRYGAEECVPMTYAPETGTWVATHDFCCGGCITPTTFQVRWKDVTPWTEPVKPVWEPDHIEDTETDDATGAFVRVPGGEDTFRVALSDDAVIASLRDGLGYDVHYTLADGSCTFAVVPGELYVLRLRTGSFPDYPGHTELNILAEDSNTLRGTFEYRDNVYPLAADDITDLTERTFVSDKGYRVGDVLILDDLRAIAVTAVSGRIHAYEPAALDQVYKTLDVSGIDTSQPLTIVWEDGTDLSMLEEEFRESAFYTTWVRTLEESIADPNFEFRPGVTIGDTTVDIGIDARHEAEGTIVFALSFKIETEMKTKLPVIGEETTSVAMELGFETREKTDGRLRMTEDDRRAYHLVTTETSTSTAKVSVSIGEDPDSNSLDLYFSDKLEQELMNNYLEELESGGDKAKRLPLLDKAKIPLPTTIPGISFYFRPSVDLEIGFFGEVNMAASYTTGNTQGLCLTCRGPAGGWDVSTFSDKLDPQVEFSSALHLSASVATYLRAAVGISALNCLELEVFARIGPKFTIGGHGDASYNFTTGQRHASAELLVGTSLEFQIGASAFLHLKFLPLSTEPVMDYTIYAKNWPIIELGQRVMPTEFNTVEQEPVNVTAECDLSDYIDLTLRTQKFSCNGHVLSDADQMPDEQYTFELLSGPATLTPDGRFTVHDKLNPHDFEVKVTYTGSSEDYKLWKLVPLHYEPASLTIFKTAEEAPPTASFMIVNKTYPKEPVRSASTPESGKVTIPMIPNCLYEITETGAPPKNVPCEPNFGYALVYVGTGETSVSFGNRKPPEPEPVTPEIEVPPIADPSGYVFEGIASNRLSGVTATLYQADDAAGTNARLWDSAPYDQGNPLTTDAQGQYLWMVPEGWWQVRYALEGYATEESEWMVVPPIRTEVNQAMVSDAPAEASLRYSAESGALVLRFSRPVIVGSLRDVAATVDGVPVNVWTEAVDADWSVTDDPLRSRICATAFRLWFDESVDIADTTVCISFSDAETYRFVSCGAASCSAEVPANRMYHVRVENGTGPGYYTPGDTVTITAYDRGCHPFTEWHSDELELAQPNAAVTSFPMPEQDVTVTARYSNSPVHDWDGVICSRCGAVHNPFTDVRDGDFYLEPVLWAVKNGITNGTSPTTFSPSDQCMRAHVVTFLWRAAGSPAPKADRNPFVDVQETDFYYQAVLWAVEHGITNGLDATHFGPYVHCNRAQVVTFLWRAMGCPGTPPTQCPFTDVQIGQFYADAVLWATYSGITNGMSATEFGAGSICNRAQIVTFLHRTYR